MDISVLVPAKNEEVHIRKCLSSLTNQDARKYQYEIIVLDNDSEDRTYDIASLFANAVIRSNSTTIGRLRNELALHAKGSIIAYIDADCVAPKTWIADTVDFMNSNPEYDIVGGYIQAPECAPDLVKGWAPPKRERIVDSKIAATGSFFTYRSTFDKLKGFNETIIAGEDTNFCQRVIASGGRIALHPGASVIHYGFPETWQLFMRRQIWQTNDYLRTRKSGFDSIFVISAFTTFSVFFGFFSLILDASIISSLPLLVYPTMATGLALIKIIKLNKNKISYIIPILKCNYLYLAARCIGFSLSLFKELTNLFSNSSSRQ